MSTGADAAAISHHCPGCGTELPFFARYPWYFCHRCVSGAENHAGKRLGFSNASIGGGLVWYYEDDRSRQDHSAIAVICLIRKRPVTVCEARFGGVVAQPLPSASPNPSLGGAIVDLLTPASSSLAESRLLPR